MSDIDYDSFWIGFTLGGGALTLLTMIAVMYIGFGIQKRRSDRGWTKWYVCQCGFKMQPYMGGVNSVCPECGREDSLRKVIARQNKKGDLEFPEHEK